MTWQITNDQMELVYLCLYEQGNDDVYLCIKDGDSVSVSAAFVSGRTYPEDQSQVRLIFCRIIDPTNILHSFHV